MKTPSVAPIIRSVAAIVAFFGLVVLAAAQPASLVVTTLADDGPGSLRQTISNAPSGASITFAVNGIIMLTSGELLITNDLTITGPGTNNLALDGNLTNRVFNLTSNANATISGLTIQHGQSTNSEDGGGDL